MIDQVSLVLALIIIFFFLRYVHEGHNLLPVAGPVSLSRPISPNPPPSMTPTTPVSPLHVGGPPHHPHAPLKHVPVHMQPEVYRRRCLSDTDLRGEGEAGPDPGGEHGYVDPAGAGTSGVSGAASGPGGAMGDPMRARQHQHHHAYKMRGGR